eukprot:TRINITY_DN2553_c0_g1_i2.p1 TRINITY_DN2553_c0_g1~~TRINITY_DN2553_c0_g1_i2.p1  ORF type:complete len:211 (-),score=40.27 TRINITY_DN2553_c0_g1_i2:71-676(-)
MSEHLYRLVILGDGGVGKSALTIQLTQNHFVTDYDPTIENSYRKQVEVDGISCMLDLMDTAGQEELSAMRNQYIQSGEGFLIVYSVTSYRSFEAVMKHRNQVLRIKDSHNVPMVLVGNKVDMEDKREVTNVQGTNLAEQFGCPFFECSAKTRLNVESAYYECVRQMRTHQLNKDNDSDGGKKGNKKAKTGGGSRSRGCSLL